jgi:poly-gamma-glutamate capsule biosynthesis protein CapA/YwtB (metallophosphatase superfamily)
MRNTGAHDGRRRFLLRALTVASAGSMSMGEQERAVPRKAARDSTGTDAGMLTLFLAGDVMTGRGVDQILPHPGKPELHEAHAKSALDYVALAERASGPLPRTAVFRYVWGDAWNELERAQPDARIVNLETAVTTCDDAWPGKAVHYRMSPGNIGCLTTARLDCCAIANNHVLDWGPAGLAETLDTLRRAGLRPAGAGRDATEAAAPARIDTPHQGRIWVFAYATPGSGVPTEWAAGPGQPGVNVIPELSSQAADAIADHVREHKRSGDLAVLSIHWGGNWGYEISHAQREFAHRLIDTAGIDVVHGHSSHHVKGIEVYRDRPILYGCGDLIDDYEGIGGYEAFRPGLGLMVFPAFDRATGKLMRLSLTPTRIRSFRIERASDSEIVWLQETLNREGRALGTRVGRRPDDRLAVLWDEPQRR